MAATLVTRTPFVPTMLVASVVCVNMDSQEMALRVKVRKVTFIRRPKIDAQLTLM